MVKGARWCCQRDSNTRPHPYQGCALPLELWQHFVEVYNTGLCFARLIGASLHPVLQFQMYQCHNMSRNHSNNFSLTMLSFCEKGVFLRAMQAIVHSETVLSFLVRDFSYKKCLAVILLHLSFFEILILVWRSRKTTGIRDNKPSAPSGNKTLKLESILKSGVSPAVKAWLKPRPTQT